MPNHSSVATTIKAVATTIKRVSKQPNTAQNLSHCLILLLVSLAVQFTAREGAGNGFSLYFTDVKYLTFIISQSFMLTLQFGLSDRQAPYVEGRAWQYIVLLVLSQEGVPVGQAEIAVPSSRYKALEPMFGKAFSGALDVQFTPLPTKPSQE